MNIILILIYLLIFIVTGFLIGIILKHLKKTLHRRETILTVISADLARVLFMFVSSACLFFIYREFSGPFGNESVILVIASVLQELHVLLLFIALSLQTTTFLFFFFGQKMIAWNKFQFQYIYRLLSIIASLTGTIYFYKKETGLFAKLPLYYYFLDNSANNRKLVLLHDYPIVIVIFLILVSGMQIGIECHKRLLKQKDQLAMARANEASQRLSLARNMMQVTNHIDKEKIAKLRIFLSAPSLLKRDDVFETQNQSIFLENVVWHTSYSPPANSLKSTTRIFVRSISHSFVSRVTSYHFDLEERGKDKTNLFFRKSNSCPNLQSLMQKTEEKDKKSITQNMTRALTRAISLFIVFPTLLLLGDAVFGGIKLAKPHGNTILVLTVYGIFTPLAYILGKPNVRKSFKKYFKFSVQRWFCI